MFISRQLTLSVRPVSHPLALCNMPPARVAIKRDYLSRFNHNLYEQFKDGKKIEVLMNSPLVSGDL